MRIIMMLMASVLALGTALGIHLSIKLRKDKKRVAQSNRETREILKGKRTRDKIRHEWELEHQALPVNFSFRHYPVTFDDGYRLICPVCCSGTSSVAVSHH